MNQPLFEEKLHQLTKILKELGVSHVVIDRLKKQPRFGVDLLLFSKRDNYPLEKTEIMVDGVTFEV